MSSIDLQAPSDVVRVLFVHRWGAIMAGGEVWIKALAQHLQSQRVAVAAALHIRGPLYAALEAMQVPLNSVAIDFLRATPRNALLPSAWGLLRSALRLSALVQATGSQIIHAFSAEAAEGALLAARLARVPLVVTVMNCGPYPRFDGLVLRRSDRVIAASRAVHEDLLQAGVGAAQSICIPLGITFEQRKRPAAGALRRALAIATDAPLVGMVATLERKKAQDVLLRAIPHVLAACPTAEFVLLGTDHATGPDTIGPYEAELRALAQSLGVSHRVHFPGFVPHAATLIGDLDLSVLCSRKEALGLAAIETLAAGVPMVATAVEGLREVIDHGVTGLLVPPDDPPMLAASIVRLLQDRALAARLAEQGRQTVRQRFDAATLARQNREVYDSLLLSTEAHASLS